jgi:hypothetical protein
MNVKLTTITSAIVACVSICIGANPAAANCCQLVARTNGTLKGVGVVPTMMTTEDRGIPAQLTIECSCKAKATLIAPTAATGIYPAVADVKVEHSFGDDRKANAGNSRTIVPLVVGRNIIRIHTNISSNKPLPANNNYNASIQLLLQ